MSLLPFGLADIVQECSGEQAGAGGDAVDGWLPSGGEKAVIELEGQAGHALGVGEIGIEAVRPELHAARGKSLNLFALRQSSAPDLPERIGTRHFLAVALDALGTLREDALVPDLPRIYVGKNVAGNGSGPEHVEVVDL